jgi:cytidine deaminase
MPAQTKLPLSRAKRRLYQDLVDVALSAAEHAYAPFSDYRVGCAALLWDGSVYLGVNTENPGLNLTIHGEMSAINAAITDGALTAARAAGLDQFSFIRALAIIPLRSFEAWPCGHCRDFMSGFGLKMDVIVRRESGEAIWKSMKRVLPKAPVAREQIALTLSGEKLANLRPSLHLGGKQQLDEGARGKRESYRALLDIAMQAAHLSYAPYSKRPAGAAVWLYDGSVYPGCRVENVGYTLSADPAQVALDFAIADGALSRAIREGVEPKGFIKAIAYHGLDQPNLWPSGSTRQCLCDFGLDFDIVVENASGKPAHRNLGQLLPGAFVPDVLSYWTGAK